MKTQSQTELSTNRYGWDNQVRLTVLGHSNEVVVSFLRGLDLSGSLQGAGGVGGVLAVQTGPSAQCGALAHPTHFTCYDGNGNVTALLTAATGVESARYEYGPFGEVIRATGSMAKLNPIRFSTQYADDVTGDTKYLFRDYQADTGRWLSRDPLGEFSIFHDLLMKVSYQTRLDLEARRFDFNRDAYQFIRNQPLTWIDIDGSRDTPGGDVPIKPENRRNPPKGMELLKVKPCNIRIFYGHNWEGEDKFKIGGFQNVWNIVAASDSQTKGCAYAAVITCNAYNVPNEIPLPGYTPVSGILPIKDRSADDDLARQLVEAQKAAREAAKKCCEEGSGCGCKEINISFEAYGLSFSEKWTFPTLNNETIKCPKPKKKNESDKK